MLSDKMLSDAEATIIMRQWQEDTQTIVMPLATDEGFTDLALICDALTLVADLWPTPKAATVILETHQWEKLRKVLLAIPDLMVRVQR